MSKPLQQRGTKIPEYKRRKTGRLLPCPGEAHKNPFIDNCGVCMPRWGEVDELAPVDLEAAEKAGLAIALGDIDLETQRALEESGRAAMVPQVRTGRGFTSYYNVLAWVKK